MLIDFPEVLDMRTQECHDPMIDVRHNRFKKIKYDPYIDTRNDLKDTTKMRLDVYKKLVKAQEILRKKYGFNIRLICGYRSKKIQELMFVRYWAQNQKEFPNSSYHELYKKTIKLISPLKTWEGKINIPPHSTGGAVDIDLTDQSGNVVDMGMDVKDCRKVKPEWCWPSCTEIPKEAQNNRKIMADVMEEVGFKGHTREYWHFSYGDRLWAVRAKKSYAVYDSVEVSVY